MTPDERRQRLTAILDNHDRAAERLRAALDASHEAGIHTRAGMVRAEEAHDAALAAIAAMLEANALTRQLFNDDERGPLGPTDRPT